MTAAPEPHRTPDPLPVTSLPLEDADAATGTGGGRRHRPVPLRAARPTKRRRRRRRLQWLLGGLGIPLVLLGSLFFFTRTLLEPENLTALVRDALAEEFAVPVEISRVEYRFPDRIRAVHLSIGSPEGSRFPHLVTVPEARGQLRLLPLLVGSIEMDSLVVVGAEIFVERDADGVFTAMRALRDAPPRREPEALSPGIDWTPPSITLESLRVRTCGQSVFAAEEPITIPEVTLRYLEDDPDAYTLTATATDAAVAGIQLNGTGNFRTGDLRTTLRIDRLQVDADFQKRIPQALARIWEEYQPSGTADLIHHLELREGVVTSNRGEITLENASLHMREPRIEIDGVRGQIQVDPTRVRVVDSLRGRAFGGEAVLRGSIDLDVEGPTSSDLRLELAGITLGGRLRDALPDGARDEWDKYAPEGRASLTVSASGDTFPPAIRRTVLDLQDVAARYRDFPYPVTGLSGSVYIEDGVVTIDVSSNGYPHVSVKGWAHTTPGRPNEIEVHLEDLVLDEQVRKSLPPDIREKYDEYDPGGRVDLLVLVGRAEVGGDSFTTVQITALDANLAHEAFPLRVEEVTGMIRFTRDGTQFSDIRGIHGESVITLEKGEVVSGPHGHTEIEILAPELRIDDAVVAAFPPESREVLQGFGLGREPVERGGRIDTRVMLRSKGDAPIDVVVRAAIIDPLEVRYDEFPYPLLFGEGEVVYDSGEQLVRFVGMRTVATPVLEPREVSTPNGTEIRAIEVFPPVIEVNGEQSHPDADDPERWLLAVSLRIETGSDGAGIEISDPVLVESLPPDLKEFAERMDLTGEVSGSVAVQYRTGGTRPDEVEYEGAVRLAEGSVDFGLRLYDMNARFAVHGGLDGDTPHHFAGSIDRGSYRFSRFKIDVTRPTQFVYGEVHPEILYLTNEERDENTRYRPSNFFVESLIGPDVSKTFQASLGPASLFGGVLNGFFFVDLKEGGRFGGEAEADGIRLEEGGKDLFGTSDIAGNAYGALQLRGLADDLDSMIGLGYAGIRQGRLTKIPILAAIILNPLQGFSKDNLHFDKATVKRYRVADRQIIIDDWGDLLLESPIINVKGKGSLSFDSELDLVLEPQTLGGLPIISDLVNTLTRFRLRGSLDDPEVFGEEEAIEETGKPKRTSEFERDAIRGGG